MDNAEFNSRYAADFALWERECAQAAERAEELRWAAVMLDWPYTPTRPDGTPLIPGPSIMSLWAVCLRTGRMPEIPGHNDYVTRWKAAGFTPETYALLHHVLEASLRSRRFSSEDFRVAQGHLRRLGLVTGRLGRRGDNLVPESWWEFPLLLQSERPSSAVNRILQRACQK